MNMVNKTTKRKQNVAFHLTVLKKLELRKSSQGREVVTAICLFGNNSKGFEDSQI